MDGPPRLVGGGASIGGCWGNIQGGGLGCVLYPMFRAGGGIFIHVHSECLGLWESFKSSHRQLCSGVGEVVSSYVDVSPN